MIAKPITRRSIEAITRFIQHEATAGLVLVLAASMALVASNAGPLAGWYVDILSIPVRVEVGGLVLAKPLVLWINDGLMAIFFFLVGLEIKREALDGHLSSSDQIALPAIAAMGGMAAPAVVYLLIVASLGQDPLLHRGWAIPAATDIAFALGALALAGRTVPLPLKVFLLTLATLDDLGSILVIALFYTDHLSLPQLVLAGAALAILIGMNRFGVVRIAPYIFIGIAMWVFVLKSGVHATLAGVALAFAIPLTDRSDEPIIERLEEGLHPYVTWIILPLFAFANAGVSLAGLSLSYLLEPLPLAIALGLLIGKPVGILAASALAVGTGVARLPEGVGWRHMLGVGCIAGIGFTMSLFIGMLAFPSDAYSAGVRIGVIAGSILSALIGFFLLKLVPAQEAAAQEA